MLQFALTRLFFLDGEDGNESKMWGLGSSGFSRIFNSVFFFLRFLWYQASNFFNPVFSARFIRIWTSWFFSRSQPTNLLYLLRVWALSFCILAHLSFDELLDCKAGPLYFLLNALSFSGTDYCKFSKWSFCIRDEPRAGLSRWIVRVKLFG